MSTMIFYLPLEFEDIHGVECRGGGLRFEVKYEVPLGIGESVGRVGEGEPTSPRKFIGNQNTEYWGNEC